MELCSGSMRQLSDAICAGFLRWLCLVRVLTVLLGHRANAALTSVCEQLRNAIGAISTVLASAYPAWWRWSAQR